jgi:hypothetical protein
MSSLTPEELAELEDPDNWDFENVQHGEPIPDAGAVYAVRLQGDQIRQVSAAARRCGMTSIEFIQRAALLLAARTASDLEPKITEMLINNSGAAPRPTPKGKSRR